MSADYRKADIALIGLAVMGQNLILNMDSKGFVVCAFNRTVDKVKTLITLLYSLTHYQILEIISLVTFSLDTDE